MQVYRILLQHSPVVQPLSVDEAFLDLSSLGFDLRSAEVQALVTRMRQEIYAATGCTASAGEWCVDTESTLVHVCFARLSC